MEYFELEMQDSPVADLTSISFQYYIQNCAPVSCGCPSGCNTAPCANEIYVSVFTRTDPTTQSFYVGNILLLLLLLLMNYLFISLVKSFMASFDATIPVRAPTKWPRFVRRLVLHLLDHQ